MDGAEVLTFQEKSEKQFSQQTEQWTPPKFHCASWAYTYKEHVKF